MVDGQIVKSGGKELAQQLEAEGYADFAETAAA
jgi:Fe-S cluster assembly ATP-binding protein